jgi:hypothetical protein
MKNINCVYSVSSKYGKFQNLGPIWRLFKKKSYHDLLGVTLYFSELSILDCPFWFL